MMKLAAVKEVLHFRPGLLKRQAPRPFSSSDAHQAAVLLQQIFKGRVDVHGQEADGNTSTVYGSLSLQTLEGHVAGERRIGVHPLTDDGKTAWLCIDID